MDAIDIKNYEAHTSVLSREIIEWLRPSSSGCYIDCTLGPGGLAKVILEKSKPNGILIGIDRDASSIELAQKNLDEYRHRVQLLCGNFNNIKKLVGNYAKKGFNGIVLDLGISSVQLDNPQRGFTFLQEGPLNMRMDQADGPTAADLIETLPEADLRSLLFTFGEERYAKRIASSIVRTREIHPIRTTKDLVSVIRGAVPPSYRYGRLHCATRTFQALRIAVNQELEGLETSLRDAVDLLKVGGRICAISFHSGEDRIVKHTFRSLSQGDSPKVTVLTRKPIMASPEERRANPRARSAKLRVAERRAQV